jgi:glyoxylase-like metal-dependent hydrolase (beta-lactamase superfamily II)
MDDATLAGRAGISTGDLHAIKSGQTLYAAIRRVARHLQLNPAKLEDFARNPPYPKPPVFPRGFMMFNTPCGDIFVNSYLVWNPRSRQAAAFDTGGDCARMLDIISSEQLDLRHIFITHTHGDHVADLEKLADAAPAAEIWSSELEPINHPQARCFKENAHFHIGEITVKTLLTSGHSAGQTTYYVTGLSWPLALVGDSLFSGSVGGSATHYKEQIASVREKIFTLPRKTILACGHGPLTTLEHERLNNPVFSR